MNSTDPADWANYTLVLENPNGHAYKQTEYEYWSEVSDRTDLTLVFDSIK